MDDDRVEGVPQADVLRPCEHRHLQPAFSSARSRSVPPRSGHAVQSWTVPPKPTEPVLPSPAESRGRPTTKATPRNQVAYAWSDVTKSGPPTERPALYIKPSQSQSARSCGDGSIAMGSRSQSFRRAFCPAPDASKLDRRQVASTTGFTDKSEFSYRSRPTTFQPFSVGSSTSSRSSPFCSTQTNAASSASEPRGARPSRALASARV